MKRIYKTSLKIITTLVIFVIIFLKSDFKEMLFALKNVNIVLLVIIAIINFIIFSVVFSNRWWNLLNFMDCKIRFKNILNLVISFFHIDFIMPFKSGELLKAHFLKKYGINFKKAVSSLIYDNILDLIALIIIILIGLIFLEIKIINNNILYIIIISIIFVVLTLFITSKRKSTEFLYAFKKIKIKNSLSLIAYSITYWIVILLLRFWVMKIVHIEVPLFEAIIYLAIINLISSIPITMGGMGIREGSIILFFSQYAGTEALIVAGVLISIIGNIFPTLIGLLYTRGWIKI